MGSNAAANLFPVRVFWAAVRRRVAPGKLLFRQVNRCNVNRVLKAVMAKLQVPHAALFTSHACRRGATQDLKESGSPWDVAASAGLWNSPSFRGYLDMSRDVEVGVARLFDVGPDSGGGEPGIQWGFSLLYRPLVGLRRPLFPCVSGRLRTGLRSRPNRAELFLVGLAAIVGDRSGQLHFTWPFDRSGLLEQNGVVLSVCLRAGPSCHTSGATDSAITLRKRLPS